MKVVFLLCAHFACGARAVRQGQRSRQGDAGREQAGRNPAAAGSDAGCTPALPSRAGCAGGGWKMVETSEGLVECTEIYARPGTCRASTYGTEKRSRLWIVKTGSQWMQCQYPDLASKCVSTKALPYDAVQ